MASSDPAVVPRSRTASPKCAASELNTSWKPATVCAWSVPYHEEISSGVSPAAPKNASTIAIEVFWQEASGRMALACW